MRKDVLLIALIAILCLTVSPNDVAKNQTTDNTQSPQIAFFKSYTIHTPIVINSDADFVSQGWNGTGSSSNPFRIEYLSIYQPIAGNYCILINNTNAYFKIQHCMLTGIDGWAGIYLENVNNGIIDNNTITAPSSEFDWLLGIYLENSDFNMISNNTCIFSGHGIDLASSNYNTIFNNTCNGGSDGIWLDQSSSNVIANNTSGDHTQGAIMLQGGSANIIANNSLWDSQRGINLGVSPSNTVVNNTLINCGYMVPWGDIMQTEVSGNTVNGLPLRYHQSQSDFIINQPSGQVVLVDCANFTVEDLNIGTATIGVNIQECENGTIRNVTSVGQPWEGIGIWDSRNVNVSGCRVSDSGTGINVNGDTYDNEGFHFISDCIVERCTYGITLFDSNCTVSWNTLLSTVYDIRDFKEYNLIKYNFYEDYTGIDSDSNGIGDTPRFFEGDAMNNDSYPLMFKPFNPEWIVLPIDATIEDGESYSQPIYVTSESPIVYFEMSDETNFFLDGSSILRNATTLALGSYPIEIMVRNIYNRTLSASITIKVVPAPPRLSGDNEICFTYGTSGNTATWFTGGTFPQDYTLYLNGVSIQNGVWNSSSESISQLLDTFDNGIYTYQLEVNNSVAVDVLTTVVYVFSDSYQSHAPISILSDSDFVTQGWPGSGTADDPYIIAGVAITDADSCIHISDTSSYFIIFDCYLDSPVSYSGYGIQFWMVDNGAAMYCIAVMKQWAIDVYESNSIRIRDCIVESWSSGFLFNGVNDFEILNCSVDMATNTGMSISTSSNGVIDSCAFYGDGRYPLNIDRCTNLDIINNVFGQKGFYLTGESLYQYISIHFAGNIIDGKSLGLFVNVSDVILSGDIYGQYLLINCSRVTLNGGTFDYGYTSINLAFCTDCVVDGASAYESSGNPVRLNWCIGCTVRNCNFVRPVNNGIVLNNCIHCYVHDNIVDNTSDGINLWRCGDCAVFSNTITSGYSGVNLIATNLTSVYENTVEYAQVGVELWDVTNCSVYTNILQYNRWYGVQVYDSQYCIIRENTLLDNDEYGIYIWGNSWDNLFYLNSIGDNGIENALDDSAFNDWDNGTIGNWWRDYSGTGFYNIPGVANSIDHYPQVLLMVHIPNIVTPLDFQYDVGTTGNTLSWDLTNFNSGVYYIYRNDSLVDFDTLSSNILVSVDGLSIGYYVYTLIIAQMGYENVTDIVHITVVLDSTYPVINSPDDVVYAIGTTGHRISWIPIDLNPNYYEIRKDGIIIEFGNWSASWNSINITVDGLEIGMYSYTLTVSDIVWQNATDSVQVIVLSELPTTSTDTTVTSPTSSTTTTSPTGFTYPEILSVFTFIITIGSAVCIVVVIVLILRSRSTPTYDFV